MTPDGQVSQILDKAAIREPPLIIDNLRSHSTANLNKTVLANPVITAEQFPTSFEIPEPILKAVVPAGTTTQPLFAGCFQNG